MIRFNIYDSIIAAIRDFVVNRDLKSRLKETRICNPNTTKTIFKFSNFQIATFSLLLFSSFIDLNSAIFTQKMNLPKGNSKAENAFEIAKSFKESPYKAHTLEASPEKLVVNLREFDCMTFVESVLALTQAKTNHPTPKYYNFQQYLELMRYHKGKIDGYGSRLHYFSEWIAHNTKRGVVQDVTTQFAEAEPFLKSINFMSGHRQLYPSLSDSSVFDRIVQNEKELAKIKLNFIPKTKVKAIENQLRNGDIVAITSTVEGLDFNHEGFVIRKGERTHLIHASTEQQKVVEAPETLAEYLSRIKKHSGIVVLRIRE